MPGLDEELPQTVWDSFQDKNATLDHPQAGFAKLFTTLDLTRQDVQQWHHDTDVTTRNKLISLALRPAPITNQWLEDGPNLLGSLDPATKPLAILQASTPKEEALAIATCLRNSAHQGIDSVLITPNRDLTRRVSATLKRWGIEADDFRWITITTNTTWHLFA